MAYKSLEDCIIDLEKNGHLIRIKEVVDPNLEMAAIHLRVFENEGPALLFENIKGSKFRAVSNLFGTLERSKFMFKNQIELVKQMVDIKVEPIKAVKNPFKYAKVVWASKNALPKKIIWNKSILQNTCSISDLPQIKHWPMDGGSFITLPIVYSEDIDKPGIMNSNIGMYRIQLSGNDYKLNKEIGLHYQLHRGIGVHQSKSNAKNKPLKVSVFVGGPPAHTLGAVMPLPEGLSELTFAGALEGRRFRYCYDNEGFVISTDADFVITGEIYTNENKQEGPFGDHLGYYSLKHDFPVMRVKKVYHKKNAIWPFTVVGRPPQEDTQFGALIHEITGKAISHEIPGLKKINAVDAAGVHPLLLAIGSERYTPYIKDRKPQEILTIANHIFGTGQMSLAKYLFIITNEDNPNIDIYNYVEYFTHVFERVNWQRDLHFYTNSTIDTLDYSGTGLNSGSKVAITVAGNKIRELCKQLPTDLNLPDGFENAQLVLPGVIAVKSPKYISEDDSKKQLQKFTRYFENKELTILNNVALFLLVDDSEFTAKTINNFLWITFTRSNPSHDIYGIGAFTDNKHWGCKASLIIDARIKTHHAPPLIKSSEIEKRVDKLGEKNGSLFGII